MRNKNNQIEEFDEIEIKNAILNDTVPKVSTAEIIETCDIVSNYLPKQRKNLSFDKTFWKIVFLALNSKNLLFWLICAFSLASCTLLPKMMDLESNFKLVYFIAISPLPFMFFCISELYNKDKRIVEFEMTCHYNPREIFTARLSICMLINIVMLLITGIFLNGFGTDLIRIYLYAFCLMFLIGSIATIIMSYVNNTLPLSALLFSWLVIGMSLVNNPEIIDTLSAISILPILIALAFSILLFISSSLKTTRRIYA